MKKSMDLAKFLVPNFQFFAKKKVKFLEYTFFLLRAVLVISNHYLSLVEYFKGLTQSTEALYSPERRGLA